MLLKPVFVLVAMIRSALFYHQVDYEMIHEHIDTVSCNQDYMDITVKNFKFNRTIKAFNSSFTWKQDIGYKLTIITQAYKFASNEYRLFPLVFKREFCTSLDKDEFGVQIMYSCGNFTGCPLNKGQYQICNLIPDSSKLPPNVPRGNYMFDFKAMHYSDLVIHFQWYFKIVWKFH